MTIDTPGLAQLVQSKAKIMFRNILENCETMQRKKKTLRVKVNVNAM